MKNNLPRPTDETGAYGRAILLGAAAGLLLAAAFAGGFVLRDVLRIPVRWTEDSQAAGYPLLDEVQSYLDAFYLREQPSYATRQYEAIRGMLKTLDDPHTFFIDPPVAQSEADALAGTYGGIGVLLQRDSQARFVLYPYPDSPAQKAGIQDGAILLAIQGERVALTTQQDAVDQQMRGEVKTGSGIEITVQQPDNTEFTQFIEFAVINVPSVLWRVLKEDERIGYIQILRFTNRTPDEVIAALTELRKQPLQGLIIDLRNNTGGLFTESLQVAQQFLASGVVAYERDNDSERAYEAKPGGLATDLPLVLLVNKYTASAAEIVAGALRDQGRGILVGQQTYGKGSVQQIFGLSDGSSIHVTAAEWLTPNRNALDGVGLTPDIAMIPAENGSDVEIGEAILYLQKLFAEQETTP